MEFDMDTLPLFYFPTQILFIDDDEFLLNTLSHVFEREYNFLTTTDSDKALELLSQNYKFSAKDFLIDTTGRDYCDLHLDISKNITVKFNFDKIDQLIKSTERINTISLIIVDYNMPNINGLELCRKITDKNVKKILLTGEASDKSVIAAFNDNLIDGFVKKGEKDAVAELKKLVDKMLCKFFIDITLPLIKNLEITSSSHFLDSTFVNFFKRFIIDYSIIEYFLINNNGTYILQNKEENKFIFIIQDEESLSKNFIEPYEHIDEISNIIKTTQEKKLIPHFGINKDPLQIPFNEWQSHLYTSEIIYSKELDKIYYWALIPIY